MKIHNAKNNLQSKVRSLILYMAKMQHVSAQQETIITTLKKLLCKLHNIILHLPCMWLGSQLHKWHECM
jgi:hypothetical protein